MRTALVFVVMLLASVLNAQTVALKKHAIGNSGCTVYNYCDPKYKVDFSTDSSKVYTGECKVGEFNYGVICVKLLNPVANLSMAEDLLVAYLDYLKGNFSITNAAGYGRGHRLNNNENTRGIVDYWEDAENDKWKIKAWTDGKFIGFLYVYGKKDPPEPKADVFLDGFRLPGMK